MPVSRTRARVEPESHDERIATLTFCGIRTNRTTLMCSRGRLSNRTNLVVFVIFVWSRLTAAYE